MNFNAPNKVFIKAKNDVNKIINNYNISLIIHAILVIISNLLIHDKILIISYIKSLIISLSVALIFSYIINLIKKEYSIKKLCTEDCIISIAIIISLFSININIYTHITAIIIAIIIKNIIKNINISASLYGILVILLYKYFTNSIEIPNILINRSNIIKPLLDINYLCPLLSIIAFIYLFCHKSIKYSLVFSYLLTFTICMLFYCIFNSNLYFLVTELVTSNIIFLTVYTLTDYKATPTINEGNTLYGMILGIISAALRFIIPNFAIIIPLIIGPVLTKAIDNISPELKYNKKLYISIIVAMFFMIITLSYILSILD